MSKRFVFNQQYGERKKARLDVTISDHNFPLSQNTNNKDIDNENWGDDNDDEILLLASQACDQALNETSLLTDYSICMQPGSTSTQYESIASTSKAVFSFKKPSANPPSCVTTNLRNKCNTISSPLPGMSSNIAPKHNEQQISITDDLVFNDKICKGQDPDFMYRQLLQLQEENNKLKSENGKLLEKCVTKEGEASILRTQLKSSQIAIDHARIEKIKAQEKVQIEWNEKLAVANTQMHDLRTQLDFKNLEIISIKEKCKKLESSKVKLTQINISHNDISSSHRNNNTLLPNEYTSQARRVKVLTNGVQTEDKAEFVILKKIKRKEPSILAKMLPLILDTTSNEQQYSILDYNEKLQKHIDYAQTKCRVFSTFHRIPSAPTHDVNTNKKRVCLSNIFEDLTLIASGYGSKEAPVKSYYQIFNAINLALQDISSDLEIISKRVTTAFQKEMDEKYIEASSTFPTIQYEDLLKNSAIFKDEQAVITRRMMAIASCVIASSESLHILKLYEQENSNSLIDSINRICNLLDSSSCALLYSGLLYSTLMLLDNLLKHSPEEKSKILNIVQTVLASRPMPFVSSAVLVLMRRLASLDDCLSVLCPGVHAANLKVDYDQGVLLYRKDSCHFQVLLKQVETALKCIDKQGIDSAAAKMTSNLIGIYSNISNGNTLGQDRRKCDCQLMLVQTIVYSLRICAVMLKKSKRNDAGGYNNELLAICRSGILILYQCALRDVEFSSQLAHDEGHLICVCEIMKGFDHNETYENMLTELMSTFQASPEEISSFHRQPWLKSFESFSLTD